MFNRELFVYDETTHTGTYDGTPVPSVTQLLDILYPYSEDIPKERLEKAAQRGTELHTGLEVINSFFDNSLSMETNLEEAIDTVIRTQKQELIDYVSILSAYGLRPFDYEALIFLLDENGDLICYGHYDCTFLATKDIMFKEKVFVKEGNLYMTDFKTTSLYDKPKVALQLNIYSLAYEQCSKNNISGVFGTWFNQGIKLMPHDRQDNNFIISLCKNLKGKWYAKRQD